MRNSQINRLTNEELALQIGQFRNTGQHKMAHKLLRMYTLRKNLSDYDYFVIMQYYFLYRNIHKTLKFTKKFKRSEDYQLASNYELAQAFYLSLALSRTGIFYKCRQIQNEIIKINRFDEVIDVSKNTFYGQYAIYLFYDNKKKLIDFRKEVKIEDNSTNAITLASFLYTLILTHLDLGNIKKARQELAIFKKINFPTPLKERCLIFLATAELNILFAEKKIAEVKKIISTLNKEVIPQSDFLFLEMIEIKILKQENKIDEIKRKVAKRLKPLNPALQFHGPFEYLMLKRDLIGASFQENVFLDCTVLNHHLIGPQKLFVISGRSIKSIESKQYIEHRDKLLKNQTPFIDLITGQYFNKGNYYFSPLQAKILRALIGASSYGIHFLALCDYLWEENFSLYGPIHQQIHRIVEDLRKMGFEIQISKSIVRLIKLPIDSKQFIFVGPAAVITPLTYLKIKYRYFTSLDIEDDFQIGKTSSSSWIRDWLKQNIIELVPSSNKRKYYRAKTV